MPRMKRENKRGFLAVLTNPLRRRCQLSRRARPTSQSASQTACSQRAVFSSYNLSVGLTPASSPCRGASGEEADFSDMPRPPLDRSNNDDRRQWRKQGVAVGAAASKTQAKRCGGWVPQPGQWHRVSDDGEVYCFCLSFVFARRAARSMRSTRTSSTAPMPQAEAKSPSSKARR